MAAGDVITNIYDPNNGKLQYEFIKHADGSYTVWQYDTEPIHLERRAFGLHLGQPDHRHYPDPEGRNLRLRDI